MSDQKKRILPVVILLSLSIVTLLYWWGYQNPALGMDEANTYFVYMRNLAEGHGFVWIKGGERVEGFSSLLWTLTGALCYNISAVHLPLLLRGIASILTFFTIYSVILFSRKLNNSEHKTITVTDIIILFLLFSSIGFIEWMIFSLMDVALWTFLLIQTTLQLCKYYIDRKINILRFSMMLILLNLARPESIAYNVLFILILTLILYIDNGRKLAIRKILIPVLAHLVTIVSLAIWRLSYFGYPLPNTFYAKISFSVRDNILSGLQYLLTFFYSYPLAAFITAILFFFGIFLILKLKSGKVRSELTNKEKSQAILLTVIICGLALPVAAGGDHFQHSRLYQPLIPLMYLSVTHKYLWEHYWASILQRKRWAIVQLMIAFIFAALCMSKSRIFDFRAAPDQNVQNRVIQDFKTAEIGRDIGSKLNMVFEPCINYPTVGTLASGGIGYVYAGKTIDLSGSNNAVMAHATTVKTGFKNQAAFDRKGFWVLMPDMVGTFWGAEILTDTSGFILPENTPDFRKTDFIYLCFKGIFDDRAFREMYFPALVRNRKLHYFVFDYYKDTFLHSLDSTSFDVTLLERKFNPELKGFTPSQ